MRKSIASLALVAVAATGGVACGTDSAAAGDSQYCQIARQWAVHELDPRDDANPAWLKSYWAEYLAFTEQASAAAPDDLRDDWAVYLEAVTPQTAVFEKYGYDIARGEREGTDAEKAAFEPSEAAQRAFHNVLRYEALTCDAGQPPADANADFSGAKPGAYCDVLARDNERIAPVEGSGFRPADVKRALVDPATRQAASDFVRTAPPAIEADVRTAVEWRQERQVPTMEKFGFDLRKVLLEGSAQDRRDVQSTDERVRDAFARVLAYEEQVCGA